MSDVVKVADYPDRILVVEDECIILDNIREELADIGFDVISACCAVDACGLIDEQGRRIGVVFLDVDLGCGGDGFAVARHARAARPDVKVVYTSGGVRSGLLHERVDHSLFVSKPYRPSEITALITDLLSVEP